MHPLLLRRRGANCNKDSPYYEKSMQSIETMKKDEMEGISPDKVARLVCRLVESKKLRPRYYVELKYTILMFIKRFVPEDFTEKTLMKLYMN